MISYEEDSSNRRLGIHCMNRLPSASPLHGMPLRAPLVLPWCSEAKGIDVNE